LRAEWACPKNGKELLENYSAIIRGCIAAGSRETLKPIDDYANNKKI